MAQLSPAEQAAALQQMSGHQVESQADVVIDAALSARQNNTLADLLPQLIEAAAQFAQDEASGSPYANLAQFVRAVIAVLQGQPPEPVSPEYADRLAAFQARWGVEE